VLTRCARIGTSLTALLGTWLTCGVALAEGRALAPGQTVRLTAPKRIEIPDIVVVEPDGTTRTSGRSREWAGSEGDPNNKLTPLEVGGRTVQILKPGSRVVGWLSAVDAETITIVRGGKTVSILRGAVTNVEVRRRAGHPGWGALGGFVLGYAIGTAIASESDDWDSLAWVLLCVPGMIAGGVVGHRIESWELVSTENVKLGVAPRRGGAVATVTVSF
jgi:outer membrane lipoprotein SlyB